MTKGSLKDRWSRIESQMRSVAYLPDWH